MLRTHFYCLGVAFLAFNAAAKADTFRFDTDPFAGTNVLNAPGRQIVGGENFISFNISRDVFSLESTVFGVGDTVNFVNATAANLPATEVNVIVLDSFDNDNNHLTPFGAGNAADLIADHITTQGPGFFIYFNQSLDLPRLVFSTDLSSHDADLKILARMLNLNGAEGRNAMPTFTAENFTITTNASSVPEPTTVLLMLPALGACCYFLQRKRRESLSTARNPVDR